MSVIGSNILAGASGSAVAGFQIDRSLRFNSADSAYLYKNSWGTPTNRKKGTLSVWAKRSTLSGNNRIFHAYDGSSTGSFDISFNSDDTIGFNFGGSAEYANKTNALFRDASAWYHLVFVWDTTDATSSNRLKVYVNGTQQTLATSNYPGQNHDAQFPTASTDSASGTFIGAGYGPGSYLNGYLAELYFVDGQALAPTDFGEFDADTGVWNPIEYAGTYGTNGFKLDFSDNTSTTTIAEDSSGNNNDFTANNFSVASGAGNDSLIDTPTNYDAASGNNGGNYATLNPLAKSTNVTLSNGNLDYTAPSVSVYGSALSTIGVSSGKWYAEYVWTSGSTNSHVGVATGDINLENWLGASAGAYTYYADGTKYNNGTSSSYGASYANGDVIGVAFDADAGTLVFYKNGTSQGTAFTGLTSGPYFFGVGMGPAGQTATFNFGARPFQYTPPTGHLSLCTQNLDESAYASIPDGSTAFDAVTYAGNSGTQSITGLNFGPDLVWIKARNHTSGHVVYDTIRGTSKVLNPNTTASEADQGGNGLSAFNSDGFTVKDVANGGYAVNGNYNYVGWAWDGGTSTASNTDGSITTDVRASQTNGFSIATYTGNGSANQTLGHGLGAAPAFVIIKDRSSSQNWAVLHTSAGTLGTLDGGTNYKLLELNGTAAARDASYNTIWHPTSTTVKIGEGASSAHWTNKSGDDYVMLSWTPVEGFSAFGSYTGNGSTNGPFVFTGMRPAWIMVKRTDTGGGNWTILDNARNTSNPADALLFPNLSDVESTTTTNRVDLTSNGFKLRGAGGNTNASSGTYVWAAFSEHPFKTARAR